MPIQALFALRTHYTFTTLLLPSQCTVVEDSVEGRAQQKRVLRQENRCLVKPAIALPILQSFEYPSPMDELVEDIERRKLARSREATMEEKLLDGPRLFRLSCEAIKAGLRIDFPDADEAEIHRRLIDRVYADQ